MKALKNIIHLLTITFFMTAFSNCAGSKKLQEKAPFSMDTVYCQEWVSGVKDGGAGLTLSITLSDLPEGIVMDSAYFRGMKAPLIKEPSDSGVLMIARFKLDYNKKKDIVSHEDPRKEVGNEPPSVSEPIPFKLENDEAVVSYTQKGKMRYYKIENIKSKPALAYPSAPVKKGF